MAAVEVGEEEVVELHDEAIPLRLSALEVWEAQEVFALSQKAAVGVVELIFLFVQMMLPGLINSQ